MSICRIRIFLLVCAFTLGCQQITPNVTSLGSLVSKIDPKLSLYAGKLGDSGSTDGVGNDARFSSPIGITVDSAGTIYVADSNNSTIRKITPAGAVTTLAGLAGVTGFNDGVGASARFYSPNGITVDSVGNVYVADSNNSTIRKITPAGAVTTLAGLAGVSGSSDGTGSSARFYYPTGIAVDSAGNVYVADTNNYIIRKITSAGVVTTLAGFVGSPGASDGTGSAARFFAPYGLAVDSAGILYVADTSNDTIRKVTPAGVVTTFAGAAGILGSADGTGAAARFNHPNGITVDSSGNVYVADTTNSTIRKITPGGVVATVAGLAGTVGSSDGTGTAARFYDLRSLAVDSLGNIYVADSQNSAIRKVTASFAVTTIAGVAGDVRSSVDGTGLVSRFYSPYSIALDANGTLYVADTNNSLIRKVTAGGAVTTLAGLAGAVGSADGTGSAARFANPTGVAVDTTGNLYVADSSNSTIRKITPTGVVTTLAGLAGAPGTSDGTGSSARFGNPFGVAVDSAGNVFVADTSNSTVRKITPGGAVTTLAGVAGVSGSSDGTGAAAQFSYPAGITTDSSGNIYLADNSAIRKITPGGSVTTLAGVVGVTGSSDGVGVAARFKYPVNLAVDSVGNIYVADTSNSSIRKITSVGNVTTVVGVLGINGTILGLLPASINYPHGVAVSGSSLYIASEHAILTCPLP